MKIHLCLLSFISLLGMNACAQQPDPTISELQRQIDAMRRQMTPNMGEMDTTRLGNGRQEYFQISPDSSSYFYFRVDTSFGGDMSKFFRFDTDPFGNGSEQDPFAEIFRQMEEMQRQMGIPPSGFSPWGDRLEAPQHRQPADDGNAEQDMLPEERLRLQEQPAQDTVPPSTAPPKKPKLKTTRI